MRSEHVNGKIMLKFRNWCFVWILQLLAKEAKLQFDPFSNLQALILAISCLSRKEVKSHHDKLACTGQWWLEWYVTKANKSKCLLSALIVNIIDTVSLLMLWSVVWTFNRPGGSLTSLRRQHRGRVQWHLVCLPTWLLEHEPSMCVYSKTKDAQFSWKHGTHYLHLRVAYCSFIYNPLLFRSVDIHAQVNTKE